MDTFNQFWKDLEGMLDNLSQPVAFATAPLARFGGPESARGPDDRSSRRTASNDSALELSPQRLGYANNHGLDLDVHRQSGSPPRVHVEPTALCKANAHSDDLEEVMADDGQYVHHLSLFWMSTNS